MSTDKVSVVFVEKNEAKQCVMTCTVNVSKELCVTTRHLRRFMRDDHGVGMGHGGCGRTYACTATQIGYLKWKPLSYTTKP